MVNGYHVEAVEEQALDGIQRQAEQSRFPHPNHDLSTGLLVVSGALREVLRIHRTVPYALGRQRVTCAMCGGPWPCPTRRAVRDELLSTDDAALPGQ